MVQEELIRRIFRLYPWILLSVVFVFIFAHFVYSLFYPNFIGEKKEIYVPPKTKISLIANELEKEGVIKSAFYFKLIVFLKKTKIKAGIYEFSGFYNLFDVIKILEKGGKGIKVTIIEGMTMKEIENLLKEKRFKVNLSKYKLKDFSESDLKNYFPEESSLEGFLAPDTYEFFPSENEKEIILKFLNNFSKKFLSELLKGTDFSLYERLILASIIEKEAKHKEDFSVIAGILVKRLKSNMTLDVDAALVYEKCGFIFCTEPLTKKDLQTRTPYNTYQNIGLPPAPISNPGILAIKSVINPLMTDYWFYLTADDGKAIFAKTLKEHQGNIKKYLKK